MEHFVRAHGERHPYMSCLNCLLEAWLGSSSPQSDPVPAIPHGTVPSPKKKAGAKRASGAGKKELAPCTICGEHPRLPSQMYGKCCEAGLQLVSSIVTYLTKFLKLCQASGCEVESPVERERE